jgi:hypothetical protein
MRNACTLRTLGATRAVKSRDFHSRHARSTPSRTHARTSAPAPQHDAALRAAAARRSRSSRRSRRRAPSIWRARLHTLPRARISLVTVGASAIEELKHYAAVPPLSDRMPSSAKHTVGPSHLTWRCLRIYAVKALLQAPATHPNIVYDFGVFLREPGRTARATSASVLRSGAGARFQPLEQSLLRSYWVQDSRQQIPQARGDELHGDRGEHQAHHPLEDLQCRRPQ